MTGRCATNIWCAVLAPGLVGALAGCGFFGIGDPGTVDGPVLTRPEDRSGGLDAIVGGTLALDDGCLRLGGIPVLWPSGTTWDAETSVVVLPSGDEASVGAEVTGGGGYSQADSLAGFAADEVAEAAADCAGPTGEVGVFNAGAEIRVVDPG